MKRLFFLILFSILSLPALAQSNSIDGQVEPFANAAAACGPSLPIYDANVRRRPLAVQNESTNSSNGFVTCAFPVDKRAIGNSYGGTENFSIMVRNVFANGNRNVTCTAVSGVDDGQAQYWAKTVTVAPGERKIMTWNSGDFGYGPNGFPSALGMSCNLPAGTALNEWTVHWDTVDRIN